MHACPPDRLASSSALDEHAPFSVGIPSWLRESTDPSPGRNYFFMHIQPAAASKQQTPRGDHTSLGSGVLSDHMPVKGDDLQAPLIKESGVAFGPQMMHKSPIPDLVLGPLLGKGGYGKVFRGLHKGQEVAVKVCAAMQHVVIQLRLCLPVMHQCMLMGHSAVPSTLVLWGSLMAMPSIYFACGGKDWTSSWL